MGWRVSRKMRREANPPAGDTACDLVVANRWQIDAHVEADEMQPTSAEHLLTNVLALALFPFVARTILQSVYDMDDSEYRVIIEERKDTVPQFVEQALARCR
jgi:hypothetical protein